MKDSENMTAASEPTVQEREIGDGNFKWWWSGDGGERYEGPFNTREDAIEEATSEVGGGETITICEADKMEPRYDIFDAEMVLEMFDEHNIECFDPDGDPPDFDADRDARRDLEKRLGSAFESWALLHPPYVWSFGTVRNKETIKTSLGTESPSYGRENQGTRVGGPNQQQERTKR